jgi:hypothetical protein
MHSFLFNMIRKVIKQGPATLLVSLPAQWVKDHGIKKGDDMSITPKGCMLEVAFGNSKPGRKVVLDVVDIDRVSIFHFIRYHYRSGATEITINFKKPNTIERDGYPEMSILEAIRKEKGNLLGMEIIDQFTHSCTLKCMVSEDINEFDKFLSKIFILIKDGFNILQNCTKEDCRIPMLQNHHDTATSFISYCYRLLNTYGYKDYDRTSFMRDMLESMEMIVDIFDDVRKKLTFEKKSVTPKFQDFVEHVKQVFNLYIDFYFKYDIKKIVALERHRLLIREEAIPNGFSKDEMLIAGELQVISNIILRNLAGFTVTINNS